MPAQGVPGKLPADSQHGGVQQRRHGELKVGDEHVGGQLPPGLHSAAAAIIGRARARVSMGNNGDTKRFTNYVLARRKCKHKP